jgi:hypothetical protein
MTKKKEIEDYENSLPQFESKQGEAVRKAKERCELELIKRDLRNYPELFYKTKPVKYEWKKIQPNLQAIEGSPYKGSIIIKPYLMKVIAVSQWGDVLEEFAWEESKPFEELN